MKNWKVVSSLNGKHPIYGYPLGETLCTDDETVKKVVERFNKDGVTDIQIRDYLSLSLEEKGLK